MSAGGREMRKTIGFVVFSLFLAGCAIHKYEDYTLAANVETIIGPYYNTNIEKNVVRIIFSDSPCVWGITCADPGRHSFETNGKFSQIEVIPSESIPSDLLGKPLWKNYILVYRIIDTGDSDTKQSPVIQLKSFELQK